MMKDKTEVKVEGKAVFYAVLYNSMRQKALDLGYSLALHGSMVSDMDLVAIAWVEDASPVELLVETINNCLDHTIWKEYRFKLTKTEKPHRRLAYTLFICGDWYIDLSVIPPIS